MRVTRSRITLATLSISMSKANGLRWIVTKVAFLITKFLRLSLSNSRKREASKLSVADAVVDVNGLVEALRSIEV